MKEDCWEIVFGIVSIIIVIGTVIWLCVFIPRLGNEGVRMTWYWWILVAAGIVSTLYLMIYAPCEHTGCE